MDFAHPDETDLDTYDTEHLVRATQTPAIRAELSKRATAQAARRRCDECWHEDARHAPTCSSVTQATECRCCEPDERSAVHPAVRESVEWSEAMLYKKLRGGVL